MSGNGKLFIPFTRSLTYMSQGQLSNFNETFSGVKVRKDIDPSKIIEKAIYLYDDPDKTFEQYGHLLYPILIKDHYGKIDKGSGYKLWQQNGDFKKFLTDHTSFYPHEEVTTQLKNIFENELVDSGMKIQKTYDSHGGFSNYWECLSDRFDTGIEDSYRKGDVVQVGISVRNGIGTSVALGIDVFTNCVACSNGAIARGQDLGSFSVSHITDYNKMKNRFLEAIPNAIHHAKKLIDYYQKSVYVKMNQKLAEEIYDKTHFSDKYYPEYFGIDPDEKKKLLETKKPSKITGKELIHYNGGDNVQLWKTFNDMTHDIWKSERLHFSGKRGAEITLHNELISIVNRNKV